MFSTQINGFIELTSGVATAIELRGNEDMIMRFNMDGIGKDKTQYRWHLRDDMPKDC